MPPPMPPRENPFIADKYELCEIAGEGGMAVVWRAVMHGAAGFTRQVAAKKIKPQYQAIQNYINMFVEEARVGSDLAHPHIVQVHDFVIHNRSYYLIMEWVEGLDLGSFVRGFWQAGLRAPWDLLTIVALDALRGLAAAHERHRSDGKAIPVIHRDVSPQNILISTNGISKLTDFGLARARDRAFSLTAPGTVKGKLNYLPPEVTYGHEATPVSDLFTMGNVLWESLAGRRLFRADSDLETFTRIRECEVPSLRSLRPDVPDALADIIHQALAREPSDRFHSARDMAKAMAEVAADNHWGDDVRLIIGNAVVQARSPQGLSADWRIKATHQEPHWRSITNTRPANAPHTSSRVHAQSIDIEFSRSQGPDESESIDVEFSDPDLNVPRGGRR